MTSLREARKAKVRRRGFYDIVVSDPTGPLADLAKAERDWSMAPEKGKAAAHKKVEAAKAAVEACRFRQWFEAITPQEQDALIGKYPALSKEERPADYMWPYMPALIAACAVEVDEDGNTVRRCEESPGNSAEDWASDLKTWAAADFLAVWNVVNDVQHTPTNESLPKG